MSYVRVSSQDQAKEGFSIPHRSVQKKMAEFWKRTAAITASAGVTGRLQKPDMINSLRTPDAAAGFGQKR